MEALSIPKLRNGRVEWWRAKGAGEVEPLNPVARRWGLGGALMMEQSGLEREKQEGVLKWVGVLSSTQQRGGLCREAKVGGNTRKTFWPVCGRFQGLIKRFRFSFSGN